MYKLKKSPVAEKPIVCLLEAIYLLLRLLAISLLTKLPFNFMWTSRRVESPTLNSCLLTNVKSKYPLVDRTERETILSAWKSDSPKFPIFRTCPANCRHIKFDRNRQVRWRRLFFRLYADFSHFIFKQSINNAQIVVSLSNILYQDLRVKLK